MAATFSKQSISQDLARRMLQAAEAKAREIGVPMCIAVCDEGGNLKAFSRMDGAALLSIGVAQDKAYTAVGFGMPTGAWYDFIKGDAPLLAGAVGGIPRLIVFAGGNPIMIDGQLVGAIGVSGGHYSQDQQCADAALAILNK